MKEKDIETEILTWLNMKPNTFAFKVNTTGFYDTKIGTFRKNNSLFLIRGTSDILGVHKGKFLAIEVKSAAGMRKFIHNPGPRELNQISFLMRVKKAGGIGLCVSSLNQVIVEFAKTESFSHIIQ